MNENAPSAAVLSRHPIAIVGVGALFPGSVDAAAFWRNIVEGKDLVTEVPPPPEKYRDVEHTLAIRFSQ